MLAPGLAPGLALAFALVQPACVKFGQTKVIDDSRVGRAAQFRHLGMPLRLQGSSSLGRILYIIGPSGHQDDYVTFLLDARSLEPIIESEAGWGRLEIPDQQLVLYSSYESDSSDFAWRAEVRDARSGRRLDEHRPRADLQGDIFSLVERERPNATVVTPAGTAHVSARGRKLTYRAAAGGTVLITEEIPYQVQMLDADTDGPMLTILSAELDRPAAVLPGSYWFGSRHVHLLWRHPVPIKAIERAIRKMAPDRSNPRSP